MDTIMAEIVGKLANYILIPNWFNKEVVEDMLNMKLSQNQYQAIVSFWNNDSYFCSNINEVVGDILRDNTDKIIELLEDIE